MAVTKGVAMGVLLLFTRSLPAQRPFSRSAMTHGPGARASVGGRERLGEEEGAGEEREGGAPLLLHWLKRKERTIARAAAPAAAGAKIDTLHSARAIVAGVGLRIATGGEEECGVWGCAGGCERGVRERGWSVKGALRRRELTSQSSIH
jgi:hypothetical protein